MRVLVELELNTRSPSEAVRDVVAALQEHVPNLHVYAVSAREYE